MTVPKSLQAFWLAMTLNKLSVHVVGSWALGPVCAGVLVLAALAPPAFADSVRVHASADAGLSPTQSRQQSLDRALADAANQEALRLLPEPASPARLEALRAYLATRALDFVQSYQELQPSQNATEREGQQPQAPAAAPSQQNAALELDVTMQRGLLRQVLTRLGFFAGERHPGVYALRLGAGVKEKDTSALAPGSVLLGLVRLPQGVAPDPKAEDLVEVSLERLPQGYYKAILRQKDFVVAADASELPALWLDVWGRYFSDTRQQPGPGKMILAVGGFTGVDAVQDFLRLLGTWDESVLEPMLEGMDIGADGMTARFACRVVNQLGLDGRLREALATRKLTLVEQDGAAKP